MPKTKMHKRKITPVTNWRWLAWYLYRKAYGQRCVSCSKPVAEEDADMYTMEGIDEVILKHKECQ